MTGKHPTSIEIVSVDEAWIADWAAEGITALERFLGIQAAFQDYLRDHDDEGA